MMTTSAILTILHRQIRFTPLYYFLVSGVLGAPQEIVEPGRIGLMIMLPWTWSIAYRRFNQGVLIRFGHTRTIGAGTAIRLSADGMVLAAGYLIGTLPGIVVASLAVAAGVISEAVYAGIVVRPVLRRQVMTALPSGDRLTLRSFLAFYVPLVLTSLLGLLAQPIGSAGLSRMPEALTSLAVWPVVTGLIFMTRSLGVAYNEVVVASLDVPGSARNLRRFALFLVAATSGILLLLTATPLSGIWFERISALSPRLAALARNALWLAVPLPALSVFQSWFQGSILHSRRTRGITEAVVIFLGASGSVLIAGVAWGQTTGLYVGILALAAGTLLQTGWLWHRSRPALESIWKRDAIELSTKNAPAD
jgi:hypothetical protein